MQHRTMFAKSLIAFVILAGCSSPSPKSPPASSPSRAPIDPSDPRAPVPKPGPGIGETCGEADACGGGAACVSYYGIAGARGPQFKTCEIRCENDAACPAGRTCNTIADGPGRVCR